jgi:hypothetical protein
LGQFPISAIARRFPGGDSRAADKTFSIFLALFFLRRKQAIYSSLFIA